MELHQKTLWEKRSFSLLPNKLKLYLKDLEGEYENYIPYENIKGETQFHCRKNPQLLFFTISALSFAVGIFCHSLLVNQRGECVLIPIILASLLATLYKIKQQNYLIVETFDRRKVIFLKDKPNRHTLESFLTQLWLYRKRYLRDRYFYINHNHDLTQQTERLRWLLEQNVITQAEFKSAQEDWIIDKSYRS